MDQPSEFELALLVRERRSRWERSGLSPGQERVFNLLALAVVLLFGTGWAYAIGTAEPGSGAPLPSLATLASRMTATPLDAEAPPVAAFLIDRFVDEVADDMASLRGASGEVQVVLHQPGDTLPLPALPDSAPAGAAIAFTPFGGDSSARAAVGDIGSTPGIWNLVLQMRDAARPISDLNVITLVPVTERKGGRIGRYLVGTWPTERRARAHYEVPRGLVAVTPQNRDVHVSEHLRLGDFLTKGQENVWPKYVALSPRLLDKLELTFQELERTGHPVTNVFLISGFRTPVYNATGGNTEGRGTLSRHMYGDAADVTIDNDHSRTMDDLDGDGRVTVADARLLARAAERVELAHPELVGGIGVYAPTGAHAGFVHIDARGFRARWGDW